MYKKEFKDVWIHSLVFLGIAAIPPLFMQILKNGGASPMQTILPILQTLLLFFPFFLGVSLFESERKQRGMEYLMSLPYSRNSLAAAKIIPRLTSLLSIFALYLLIFSKSLEEYALFGSYAFSVLYFSLFVAGAAAASTSSNFPLVSLTGLAFNVVYLAVLTGSYVIAGAFSHHNFFMPRISGLFLFNIQDIASPFYHAAAAIILLVPLIVGMLKGLQVIDARTSAAYNRKLAFFSGLLLIPAIFGAVFFIRIALEPIQDYVYLTDSRQLIRSAPFKNFTISDPKGEVSAECDFYTVSGFSANQSFYGVAITETGYQLFQADLEKKHVEPLLNDKQYMELAETTMDNHLILTIAQFTPTKQTDAVFFNLTDRKVQRVALAEVHARLAHFMGVVEAAGVRTHLFALKPPMGEYQMYGVRNGAAAPLATHSTKAPVCVNGMVLYATNQAWIFARFTDAGELETLHEIPEAKQFLFSSGLNAGASGMRLKNIVGESNDPKYKNFLISIDLETFSTTLIPVKQGFLRYGAPGSWYYFTHRSEGAGQYAVEEAFTVSGGGVQRIRSFASLDAPLRFDWRAVQDHGVIIQNKSGLIILPFPDLREMRF